MLERFNSAARQAVSLAEEEARRLGHRHLGTEHLLLGILAEANSRAARALVAYGATLDGARSKVIEAVGLEPSILDVHDLQYTDRARRALERASRLSLRRLDPDVTAEHVLVSVLDVEGRAGQVLRGLGVDLPGLREALDSTQPDLGTSADGAPAQSGPVGPLCGTCASPLEATLAHRQMTSSPESADPRAFLVAFCSACGSAVGATPL